MEDLKIKYYLRLDERNKVIKTFSDVFEKSKEADILIGEGYGSQFRASLEVLGEGLENFAEVENGLTLVNKLGIYLLKYENGLICKVSDEEIQAEIDNLPKPEPTEIEKLKEENLMLMEALAEIYEMIL